ncbi:MAG: hypothetical protein CMI30_10555 [Opitutae bacterium]|nr:hypothetical protein [Opitutae bacterium]|tara:strand:- start:5524 stop:6411 length:888 start_codon:yes stop_codon:yes gene_type:complete
MIRKIKWHINQWRNTRKRSRLEAEFNELIRKRNGLLDDFPTTSPLTIIEQFEREGVEVERHAIDYDAFAEWEKQTYGKDFPNYYKDLHQKKCLEHYLSFELLELKGSEVLMDVASAISKMPDVAKKHYGIKKVYRQDLLNEPGVNGEIIGSNAADVPLPAESIDAMTLHNSFEHFENKADEGFIQEASRLLRPGGKVCIIPLFLSSQPYVGTSTAEMLREERIPDFDEDAAVICNTKSKEHEYPIFSRHYDPSTLGSRILRHAKNSFSTRIIHFEDSRNLLSCPFCLFLTKKKSV